MDKGMRVIFMGTPEFAVATLDALIENKINVVAVVTAPDKPAGRGLQVSESAVKKYALAKNLKVLQPEKLKDESFISELRALKADLQVVVAFRMLPEVVWNMPSKGSVNLHASLLPQYRGAAPINWAVINGEKVTGVTTFFLQHEIDTGKIISSEQVTISDSDTAGTLHDKLMLIGSKLMVKTVKSIEANEYTLVEQDKIDVATLKHAPKIFKEDCKINWNEECLPIYNKVRGLSPYPTAWTMLHRNSTEQLSLKVFQCSMEITSHNEVPGNLSSDNKTYIKVATKNGFILLTEIQLAGKRKMSVNEFLRGFKLSELDTLES